jgi:hypothetical protein
LEVRERDADAADVSGVPIELPLLGETAPLTEDEPLRVGLGDAVAVIER